MRLNAPYSGLMYFLQETVDEHFGFSRYAEHWERSDFSFEELEAEQANPLIFTEHYLIMQLFAAKMNKYSPAIVAITVRFPGIFIVLIRDNTLLQP